MIGALPPPEFFAAHTDKADDYAEPGIAMTGLAAETFNDGLRAYYFHSRSWVGFSLHGFCA
jgi:uncharacterized membrane protein